MRARSSQIAGFAFILVLWLSGCGSSSHTADNPLEPLQRLTGVWACGVESSMGLFPPPGPAPLPIGVDPWIQGNGWDEDRAFKQGLRYPEKLELDFGDGAGWIDHTADHFRIGEELHAGTLTPEDFIWHTYEVPGEYTIRSRATFWDGAVIESTEDNEALVEVLADDSTASAVE